MDTFWDHQAVAPARCAYCRSHCSSSPAGHWPRVKRGDWRNSSIEVALLLVATKAAVRHRAALRWCLSEARLKAQKKIDADNAEGHQQIEEIAH